MQKEIVEDWEAIKKRWQAWWDCQLHDRPLICITCPRDGVPPARIPNVDPKSQWTDANWIMQYWNEINRTTYFAGEALPTCWNPISVGHALYFGGRPHFTHNAMWCEPAPVASDGFPNFKGWHESPWFHLAVKAIKTFAQHCHGRYFTLPFWGNHAGDILAAVRGNEELLIDIALNPNWVIAAVKKLSDILLEVHQELWRYLSPEITGVEGSLNHVGAWSPKKTQVADCDFSCMISPDVFKKMFLPPLIETMLDVDHRLYHLDGPGSLNHLDVLLAIPELHAIQWVPGAGKEDMLQWIPLLQKIQVKKKAVIVNVAPQEVEQLIRQLHPEGLCLQILSYQPEHCRCENEARQLVKFVTRLSQNR